MSIGTSVTRTKKSITRDEHIRLLRADDGPWVGLGEGLYLRIHKTKAGDITKTFCFRRGGSFRGLGLSFPETSLKQAREEARKIALGVRDAQSIKTFRDAVEDYCSTVLGAQGRGDHREAILRNHIVPHLGGKKLRDLTKRHVADAVAKLRDIPTTGREALRLTKRVLEHASDLGWVDRNVAATIRATSLLGRKNGPRQRRLDADELLRFMRASYKHPRGAFARFVLATGLRLKEAQSARREWIDGSGWLNLPADLMKSRRAHRVYLSEFARQQIETEGAYLFGAIKKQGAPIAYRTAERATEEIASDAEIETATTHDLRRTARSIWSELGVEPIVAEAMLAHLLPGLLGVYDRGNREPQMREAWNRWGARLLELAEHAQQTEQTQ